MLQPQEYMEFSQRNFLEVVLKRRWIIVILFFTIVLTVGAGTLLMTPVYKTTAKIILEKKLEQEKYSLLNLPGIIRDPYDFIASEIEIIKSRPVAETVVKKLQLHRRNSNQPREDVGAKNQFQLAVNSLIESLDVQKIKDTNVITLSYCSEDPDLTVAVVTEIVEAYKLERAKINERAENSDYLEKQIKIYDSKICSLVTLSAKVKEQWEMHSAEQKAQTLQNNLTIFQEKLSETQSQYDAKKSRLDNLRRQIMAGNNFLALDERVSPSLVNHISKLKEQLLGLDVEIKRALQKYTPKHKLVIRMKEEKKYLSKQYRGALIDYIQSEEGYLRALAQQINSYQSRCNDISRQVAALSEPEKIQQMIDRDLQSNREIYSMLVKQRGENQISNSKKDRQIKIKMVSPPNRPLKPVKPNKQLNFMLAGILGLLVGTGAAFGFEYLDHSYRMIQEKRLAQRLPGKFLPPGIMHQMLHRDYYQVPDREVFPKRRRFNSESKGWALSLLVVLFCLLVTASVLLALKFTPSDHVSDSNPVSTHMNMGELTDEKFVEVKKRTSIHEFLVREYGMINQNLIEEVRNVNPDFDESKPLTAGEKVYLPLLQGQDAARLGRFAIHVFSFRKFNQALDRYSDLSRKGYNAALISVRIPNEGQFYKIIVAAFNSETQAERYRRNLLKQKNFNYANLWDLGEVFDADKRRMALCNVVQ